MTPALRVWNYFKSFLFFLIHQGFLSQTLTTHRADGKGRRPFLFHFTTSTRSWTFGHLFATLQVRWLSHIFSRNAFIYQTATRWDLPPYWITISLIDVILIFVCLLDDLIFGFVAAIWHERNRWNRTHIDYHPCTRELTNQVC